jgi:hypothetical protein
MAGCICNSSFKVQGSRHLTLTIEDGTGKNIFCKFGFSCYVARGRDKTTNET